MKFDSRAHIAAEVRAAMARQKMTQSDLAEQLGVSRAALARRLGGHQPFAVDQLYRISELLDVPFLSLLPSEEVA